MTAFYLCQKIFYLTINILDRYLSVEMVPSRELRLVGITAMFIASKYEEIFAPSSKTPQNHLQVDKFAYISDWSYSIEQILVMENSILDRREWYLTVPTPYVFLACFIKASTPDEQEIFT
ncbi:Cyclin, N-terminal [Dillenia turbinata]|uniref:Cyclin, N-terminal n=1 Tax=Dillenia turbinata TaxID=194707 RepID=A0AAN8VUZ3_9MAGN